MAGKSSKSESFIVIETDEEDHMLHVPVIHGTPSLSNVPVIVNSDNDPYPIVDHMDNADVVGDDLNLVVDSDDGLDFEVDGGDAVAVIDEENMGNPDIQNAADGDHAIEADNAVVHIGDDGWMDPGGGSELGDDSEFGDSDFEDDNAEMGEVEADDQQNAILNMEDPEKPLYPGSVISQAQAFLLLLNFIIRFTLTNECVQALLELMDILFPNTLPKSRYLLYKNLKIGSDYCKVHLFCENCLGYIGVYNGIQEHQECPGCSTDIDTEKTFKNGCFFLCMSIESQLRELLPQFQEQLVMKSVVLQNPDLTCPLNGRVMREYYERGSITDQDITLLMNCDGAPVFKSSNRAIWPIQLTVNEIHGAPAANKILAGLWFYSEKPSNHVLFKPFVEELAQLGRDGFSWGLPVRKSKAFMVCCTSDACARPILRNAMQFNGAYGCDFCTQRGERIVRGGGFSRIYTFEPNVPLRTAESFREDALRGSCVHPSRGVKGVSELMLLPNFDMVRGFVPDYLHCVCYGVMRMLFTLWFDSSNHNERFYIGTRIPEIDARLQQLRPPSEIQRVSNSITDRGRWKASEFRSFLLFYSMIILEGILRAPYYQHLYLLVFAIHCVTQDSISVESIGISEIALRQFVEDVPRLYTQEYCMFNVHQLLHIPNAVRDWGPFHLTSTFRFESNIGALVSLVRGTKCVPSQICRTFSLKSYLPRLIGDHFPADGRWKALMKRLNCSGHYVRKIRTIVDGVNLYGAPRSRRLNNIELFALFSLYGVNARHRTRYYKFYRALASGSLYLTTVDHNKEMRHADFVALDVTGIKQMIVSCCVGNFECGCEHNCECPENVMLFVRPMNINQSSLFTRRRFDRGECFHQLVTVSGVLHCISPREIAKKCFQSNKGNNQFCVVPLPNTTEVY